jgi:hypothetical protein
LLKALQPWSTFRIERISPAEPREMYRNAAAPLCCRVRILRQCCSIPRVGRVRVDRVALDDDEKLQRRMVKTLTKPSALPSKPFGRASIRLLPPRLLDHLIRPEQHGGRNRQADLLGCFQMDDELGVLAPWAGTFQLMILPPQSSRKKTRQGRIRMPSWTRSVRSLQTTMI